MRKLVLYIVTSFVIGLCAGAAFPQTPTTPTLSASEQIALGSLMKQQSDLQQQYQSIQKQEQAIVAEFAQQHPGWHLDANFSVVKDDAKPVAKEAKPDGK